MVMAKEPRFARTPLPLPYDLLHIILQELTASQSYSTLSKLSTLSRDYHSIITPLIYTHVHIKSDDQLQQFLTLPHTLNEKGKKIGKTSKAFSVLGAKRGRSGSIKKSPIFKLDSLALLQSLTLDVYPSRSSLKLASKLPQPLPASLLTFTPKAIISLHSRLSRSNAPRILATRWATHLPTLIRPRKVVVDYSTLDVKLMSDKAWVDTMGGMSVAIHSWTNPNMGSAQRGVEEVEIRGGWWTGILPGPGVRVTMDHTPLRSGPGNAEGRGEDHDEDADYNESDHDSIISLTNGQDDQGDSTEPDAFGPNGDNATTAPMPAAPLPNDTIPTVFAGPNANPDEPNPLLLQAVAERNALITERIRSLILGLSTSQALHDTAHCPLPLSWEIKNFIPPPIPSSLSTPSQTRSHSRSASYASLMRLMPSAEEEEELRIDSEREERETIAKLLVEVDNTSPGLGRRYGVIDEAGRRRLSCLVWR